MEYLTFVTDIRELEGKEGQEIRLTLRDLTPGPRKYDARIVRAVVARSRERLPEGDTLWVRSWTGYLYPEPWVVKVLEEVGEYIPGTPHGETLDRLA